MTDWLLDTTNGCWLLVFAWWLDREEWIKHCHARKATCPQCGHRWAAPACGPTHAAICAARRSMPSREAMK